MVKEALWSPAAENDFEHILNYLQLNWGTEIVFKFINEVERYVNLICKAPKMFPLINKDLQVRKMVITKQNTVYYRELQYNVEIIRLFDTRQNPKDLLL